MAETFPTAQVPLILRYHRLMDAFAKSDDERDFYLDKVEGFLVYADLDKDQEELTQLDKELHDNSVRYCLIPKMALFEIKKFMEGFVNEKVYDIDTKEKLLDIISAKEARENFLEFIYDNLTELEKWQQYYQERFRIRIIEWLRLHNIKFVFEEDLDLSKNIVEKLKHTLFDAKVPKDINSIRSILEQKAKTYYSNEALNPRPKRGRPPKQVAKVEFEPQMTMDIYKTVPKAVRLFLYIPDISSASSVTFSAKFESEEQLLASLRGSTRIKVDEKLEALSQRLESLQNLSNRLTTSEHNAGFGKVKSSFQPFIKPKLQDTKKFEISAKKEYKIEEAIQDVLPTREKEVKLKEGEYVGPKRKHFSIKKVAKIKSTKRRKD